MLADLAPCRRCNRAKQRRQQGVEAVLDRVMLTNDDGIDAPGMAGAGGNRRPDRPRSLGRRPRTRPERPVPRDQPASRAAHQRTRRPPLRRHRHARRLRRDRPVPPDEGHPAATGAVRRQPRPEPRHGNGLLRHRRRRHDRHDAGRARRWRSVRRSPTATTCHGIPRAPSAPRRSSGCWPSAGAKTLC